MLVESTALFDTAGIDLKAHKAVKVKTKGTNTHTHAHTLTLTHCINTNIKKYIYAFLSYSKNYKKKEIHIYRDMCKH